MLKLFNEIVHKKISRIAEGSHQFHIFDLPNLNDEDRSSLFISRVEPIWAQFFNFIVLLKFKILYHTKVQFGMRTLERLNSIKKNLKEL